MAPGKFGKLPSIFGSIMPGNFLNGRPPSPPTAQPELPVEPSAKRQKLGTEDAFPTSQSQVVPIIENQSSPPPTQPTHSTIPGQSDRKANSVQSSNKPGSQLGVSEYRTMEKRLQIQPKRKRHKETQANSLANPHVLDDTDEVGDGGAEEDVLQANGHGARNQHSGSNDDFSRYFRRSKPGATSAKKGAPPNQGRDSSPDPLGHDVDQEGRNTKRMRTQASQSESLRGGITSTSFAKRTNPPPPRSARNNNRAVFKRPSGTSAHVHAQKIVQDRLRVKSAASGDFGYPAPAEDLVKPCILRIDDVSTILLPTDESGKLLEEYSYLSVDMSRVHSIAHAEPPSCIVSVTRATQPEKSAAAKLFIEFTDHEAVEVFLAWARALMATTTKTATQEEPMKYNIVVIDAATLTKQLHHSRTRAKKSKVLRDNDDRAAPVADDIKLAAQRQEARHQRRKTETAVAIRDFENRQTRQSRLAPRAVTPDATRKSDAITIPESPVASATRVTRNRSSAVVERSPTPKGWTEEHSDWSTKLWRNSLVFPHQGKNRAIVDQNDIERLDEGQFLNDNIIIFYLRYLQDELEKTRPDVAKRVHFHNTFFYEKLKPTRSNNGINYDSVKGWTSKVDLFSKDFIIVPINEYAHWYVAIIYNAPKLLHHREPSSELAPQETIDFDRAASGKEEPVLEKAESPTGTYLHDGTATVESELSRMSIDSSCDDTRTKQDPAATEAVQHKREREVDDGASKVVEGDVDIQEVQSAHIASRSKTSRKAKAGPRKHDLNQPRIITLDSLDSPHSPACSNLRQYLVAELKDKKNIEVSSLGPMGMTAKGIPQQSNYCDCGVYLLGYIEALLRNPEEVVHRLLQKERSQWPFNPSQMRVEIRELIFKLQAEQKQREDDDEVHRKQRKRLAAVQKSGNPQTSSKGNATSPAKSPSPAGTPRAFPTTSPVIHHQPNSAKHGTVDASLMLTRQSAPVNKPDEVSANGKTSLVTASKRTATTTVRPMSVPREEKMPMPGRFPSPILGSPRRRLERTGGDGAVDDFVPRLDSSEIRGDTDNNPVEVDSSPDLTRQLKQNLHDAEKSGGQRTPRKPLQSDADTPRKSVELQEEDTHQTSRNAPRRSQTPIKPAVGRPLNMFRTSVENKASSSKSPKRPHEAANSKEATDPRPNQSPYIVGDFFQGRQDQSRGEAHVEVEYAGNAPSAGKALSAVNVSPAGKASFAGSVSSQPYCLSD